LEQQSILCQQCPYISALYSCHSNNLPAKSPFSAKTREIFPHVGLGVANALHNKFTKNGVRRYTFINLSFLDIKNREIIPNANFRNSSRDIYSHGFFSQEGN
jgi:hypothetical protein